MTALLSLTMAAMYLLWLTAIEFQSNKLQKIASSRLHLDRIMDNKVNEITRVLSKNASLWFNHECVKGWCAVGFGDVTDFWSMTDAMWAQSVHANHVEIEQVHLHMLIERQRVEETLIMRLNGFAKEGEVLGRRQSVLVCTHEHCSVISYRKG